ncbi:hypothetical protein BKA80DRAFT_284168 [Phyllosticta citrichinensis]
MITEQNKSLESPPPPDASWIDKCLCKWLHRQPSHVAGGGVSWGSPCTLHEMWIVGRRR